MDEKKTARRNDVHTLSCKIIQRWMKSEMKFCFFYATNELNLICMDTASNETPNNLYLFIYNMYVCFVFLCTCGSSEKMYKWQI